MLTSAQLQELADGGATVVGADGDKIGKAVDVYLDDRTGRPSWLTVKTGFFGSAESFVPVSEDTAAQDGDIRVPYTKDTVKGAPKIDPDGELAPEEEDELYRYYGLDDEGGHDAAAAGPGTGAAGAAGAAGGPPQGERPASGGTPSDARGSWQRDTAASQQGGGADDVPAATPVAGGGQAPVEEQGSAGGGQAASTSGSPGDATAGEGTAAGTAAEGETAGVGEREVGRMRLRKYAVTENVTQTVPVTREEVRVEPEPLPSEEGGADAQPRGRHLREE
ncbi:photosystem reaction center subunit H [Xylanimonas oleitrophica]|uniref:Photosystem reaction center subunit H n=1 Tax=Xylanimonas oleitrophica TaxID=2607479 RepID=A0A2W5YDW8_9MICO|nr:PRC-barrel domain-containing protein [Xylanimonas oleitrophica]PZR52531.1 photosystem reaction center subunit H [Xylanimonas oleitrophica]